MRTIGMGPIDVVWLGWGVRILEILAGVLVHRATATAATCVAVFRVVVAGPWSVHQSVVCPSMCRSDSTDPLSQASKQVCRYCLGLVCFD